MGIYFLSNPLNFSQIQLNFVTNGPASVSIFSVFGRFEPLPPLLSRRFAPLPPLRVPVLSPVRP